MLIHHHFWEPTINGKRVEDFRFRRRQVHPEDDDDSYEEWPDDNRWWGS